MSGLSRPERKEIKLKDLMPDEVHLHVFVTKVIHKKLMQRKVDEGFSIKEIVNQALEAHLNK